MCKVAMDIVAKHVEPDENGVRIAYLDEKLYRQLLWSHRPLTDFWRVGRGYAKKLEENGSLGGLPMKDGVLWCATEKVSKAELDRAVALVKEVLAE